MIVNLGIENKTEPTLSFREKSKLAVILIVFVLIAVLLAQAVVNPIKDDNAARLIEEELKKENYILIDLDWSKNFRKHGTREVVVKRSLKPDENIENYPKESISVEGSNVFSLLTIGEAYIFPPEYIFFTEVKGPRTYVTSDMQTSIAEEIIKGNSVIVK